MFLFIFLLSILTLLPGSARAEGEDTGTGTEETSSTIFQYTEVEGGISITGFKSGCSVANLEIPSEIDGKPVVAIGDEAFSAEMVIKSVSIPSSVAKIGHGAFISCQFIESITFRRIPFGGNDIKEYETYSLYDLRRLTAIYVPKGAEEVYKEKFPNYANFIQGQSIVSEYVKYDLNETKDALICKGFLGYDDGCSDEEMEKIFEMENLVIPAKVDGLPVKSIADNAFAETGAPSISIPASVTSIGDRALLAQTIYFGLLPWKGNGIWVMDGQDLAGYGDRIFSNIDWLENIYVPAGCEDDYKANMPSVADMIHGVDIISDGLKYALGEAKDGLVCKGFSGDAVAEVTIPAMVQGVPVTAIGKQAFRQNASLTSVSIPSTVKEISEEAFFDCRKLVNVSIADGSLLTTIGQGAFIHCVILEGMVIPSSVETIGDVAFSDCFKLSSMTFQRIPTEENSLSGYSADMFLPSNGEMGYVKNLFVPKGTVAAYAALLPSYSDIIMVDGGKVTLTDETGFACEDKTLYRASDLSYERTLKADGEEPGDDTPGESAQAQYATLCLPFALDLGKTAAIFDKVYAPMNTLIHHTKKSTAELEHFILMLQEQEPDAIIPAGQPVLVKLKDGTDDITLSNPADEILTAALQPKAEAMTVVDWDGTSGLMAQNKQFSISYKGTFLPKEATEADHLWTFNPDGTFGKQTKGTVHPFRLVLNVEKENGAEGSGSEGSETEGSGSEGSETENPATPAKQYVISIGVTDGTTTGIREIISSEAIATTHPNGSSAYAAGTIYDLSGRKVATTSAGSQDVKKLRKGIYVVNGKKMVVK